jgi:hypothetical protein
MSEHEPRWCVLLPCSAQERWAVPQNSLAEIVTIQGVGEHPPEQINWRGVDVPVLDLDEDGSTPWRDNEGGTGLVAVLLGLQGEGCAYWALALRGEGLSAQDIGGEQIEDLPDAALPHASAAFRLGGEVYQVPDLIALQRQIAQERSSA